MTVSVLAGAVVLEQRLANARSDNDRRRTEEILAQTPYAERYPAYTALRVDRLGNLWVHRYEPPPASGATRWFVFDSTGRLLGETEIPQGVWPWDIGADYVLAGTRDHLDVDHVRLYRLIKEPTVATSTATTAPTVLPPFRLTALQTAR